MTDVGIAFQSSFLTAIRCDVTLCAVARMGMERCGSNRSMFLSTLVGSGWSEQGHLDRCECCFSGHGEFA